MSRFQTNSCGDEVVANGDGSWKWPLTRKFAWYSPYAELYGEGGSAFLQANPYVLWYALSHGIPAESFAAGANPVPKWGTAYQGDSSSLSSPAEVTVRNIDMAEECKPGGPKSGTVNWIHSYFIQNSYFDTCVLYEKLVEHIGSRKQKKGSGK